MGIFYDSAGMEFDASVYLKVKRISDTDSPYTVDPEDFIVECDTSSGAVTVNLPALASSKNNGRGRWLVIKQVDGSNAVTVDGSGSEEIDGSTTVSLNADNDSLSIVAGTDDWLRTAQPPELATADIADGAITVAKMAVNSVDSDQYVDGSIDPEHFAAGAVDSAALATGLDDIDVGRSDVGYFYLTGTVSDTELVTISSRTYEFDTNATSTGDVAVDVSGDQTADAACTALVTAINADGSRTVDAVAMAGNSDTTAGVMFVSTVAGTEETLSTDATNGVVSAAALTGAAAVADRKLLEVSYSVTAADVTTLARTGANSVAVAGIPSTTQPTLHGLFVTNASGAWVVPVATVTFTWNQANTNYWVLTVDDGAATLSDGDVIRALCKV